MFYLVLYSNPFLYYLSLFFLIKKVKDKKLQKHLHGAVYISDTSKCRLFKQCEGCRTGELGRRTAHIKN